MDIENFIAEFKKTFVYDMLSMSLKDEQLFEHVVDDDGVLWFKEQTRQMWAMWQAAKAQAVPEGFVLVPKEPTSAMLFAASGRDIVAEHYGDENILWPELRETWKAMLEAQEPADD